MPMLGEVKTSAAVKVNEEIPAGKTRSLCGFVFWEPSVEVDLIPKFLDAPSPTLLTHRSACLQRFLYCLLLLARPAYLANLLCHRLGEVVPRILESEPESLHPRVNPETLIMDTCLLDALHPLHRPFPLDRNLCLCTGARDATASCKSPGRCRPPEEKSPPGAKPAAARCSAPSPACCLARRDVSTMDCLTGVGGKRDTTDAVGDLLGAAATVALAAAGGNNAAGIGNTNMVADAFCLEKGAGIEDKEEEEEEAEAEAEAEAEFAIWSGPGPVSEEAGAGTELLAEAEAELASAISYLRCDP
uniref:Uncharacterized protein n=1 Tax=Chromera velia CCMP2878 TaxID=1169474 RepID=A0A0G4HV09_9ALVE|eukprot:Cvel_8707.t1-p1 / transcript=Cvel_8707.t1 / gene=Cvel_8707 / organism=Chromera_velia_CCMP2878 / gene_product=hypothetical protein / transcript_product=hypothetical protein / location=Cvel_scaffold486:27791-35274(-) / protein_length=301 / sequence_SO=supercontig / SO=protein_coding / is_pseudo=false